MYAINSHTSFISQQAAALYYRVYSSIPEIALQQLRQTSDWQKSFCEILQSHKFYPLQKRLIEFLKEKQNETAVLLNTISACYIESGSETLLSHALSLFSEEQLGKLEKKQLLQMKNGYSTIYGAPPNVRGYAERLWRYFTTVLDTWLAALNFFNGKQRPVGGWEAAQILAAYASVIATPLQLMTLITPHVASFGVALALVAGICAAFGAALHLYLTFLQSCPVHLNHTFNLTEMAKNGELEITKPRYDLVNALKFQMEAAKGKRIPVLCGPAGAGKTEIIKAFAREAALSNEPGWEMWKDATIYLTNTAELLPGGQSTSSDKLSLIKNSLPARLKGKGKMVVALDEHQAAAKETLQCLLRTEVDFGSIYFIACMTDEDYKNLTAPDRRRFPIISVPGNDDKTLMAVLQWRAHKEAPELEMSEKEMESLKSDKLFEAVNNLSDRISIKRTEFSYTAQEKELAEKRQQRDDLRLQEYRALGTGQADVSRQRLEELDDAINRLEKQCEVQRQKRKQLGNLYSLRAKYKKSLYQIALISPKLTQQQRKRFLFIENYLLPGIKLQIESLIVDLQKEQR